MTRSQIIYRLKKGYTPQNLGARVIRSGTERTAYGLGDYVIKPYRGDWDSLPNRRHVLGVVRREVYDRVYDLAKGFKFPHIRIASTWRAGDWIVQERVKRNRDHRAMHILDNIPDIYDVGSHNAGFDNLGRVAIYDW